MADFSEKLGQFQVQLSLELKPICSAEWQGSMGLWWAMIGSDNVKNRGQSQESSLWPSSMGEAEGRNLSAKRQTATLMQTMMFVKQHFI